MGTNMHSRRRQVRCAVLAAALLGIVTTIIVGYVNAIAAPVLRHLTITAPAIPASVPAIRIVLFSDLHVHGPDMPPERVSKIVGQINGLDPDMVIAAGDFTGDNWFGEQYSIGDAVAPLAQLKAKLGVYAVLGNNDYQPGATAIVDALQHAGVHVLRNNAQQVGPISLGGIDGKLYKRKDWAVARESTYRAIDQAPGMHILVAHRPDEVRWAPPSIGLVLAGHTHCGQIVLPFVGALQTGSDYGRKYLCGVIREGRKILVVTAGLGTSHIPLRIGAPPDIWVISVSGRRG
jgi:hypothetical protein